MKNKLGNNHYTKLNIELHQINVRISFVERKKTRVEYTLFEITNNKKCCHIC